MSTMTTLGTFKLTIELGNAAMEGPDDLAAALRKIADHVEQRSEYPRKVLDTNGNSVGEWTVEPAIPSSLKVEPWGDGLLGY